MSENKTLMSLVSETNRLVLEIIENGGEITPTVEELLTELHKNIEAKADRCAHVIDRLEFEEAYWKEKAKALTTIAKACQNARERVRNTVKDAMNQMGVVLIEGTDARFSLYESKPALIIDEKILPVEYKKQIVEIVPDKEKLHEALSLGFEVRGARLQPSLALRISPKKGGNP